VTVAHYFETGLIVYVTMALMRRHTFKDADAASVARGLLFTFLLWPIAVIVLAMVVWDEMRK
jgi:hypothetical protein